MCCQTIADRLSTTPMKEMHNESASERERAKEYVCLCARASGRGL